MSVYRVIKNKNYTTMCNYHVRDKNISLKAIGLLTIFLTLPDDWEFSIRGTTAIVKDGKASVQSAMKELKAAGYLETTQMRDEKGKLGKMMYIIYEVPRKMLGTAEQYEAVDYFIPDEAFESTEKPRSEKPRPGKPRSGKPCSEKPYPEEPYPEKPYPGNPQPEKRDTEKPHTDMRYTDFPDTEIPSPENRSQIAITIHPYMGNPSDTLGDEECTGNSRLSIKGPRYGLYLPGRGFHIRNCRACAEYFPTVLDYCCEKYGIIEYDAGEGLVVQFHQSQTFALDEDFYIFGPVLFYMTDHEGDYTEFAANEIAGIKQMIEENTVMYSTYQVKIPALKMGRLSDIYPDYE